MSKILVLGATGFGKSTSIGNIPELKIKGLNPAETYIISATTKSLPFPDSNKVFPLTKDGDPPKEGNRYLTNNGNMVAKIIDFILENRPEIKNIIIDDSNYIMQDYYMANSMRKGYDIFKELGKFMDNIFSAMEKSSIVNFYMLAHFEEYKDSSSDTISYRFKTVGKMVQDYITPEGKFDVVLYGKQFFDESNKKVVKQFVTNYDGQFPAKSPVGMFKDTYIINDLSLVNEAVKEYYG